VRLDIRLAESWRDVVDRIDNLWDDPGWLVVVCSEPTVYFLGAPNRLIHFLAPRSLLQRVFRTGWLGAQLYEEMIVFKKAGRRRESFAALP
jgi:hypothetical protein